MDPQSSATSGTHRALLEIVARAADAAVAIDAEDRILDVVAVVARSTDLVSSASIGAQIGDLVGPDWKDLTHRASDEGQRPREVRVTTIDPHGQHRELQISIAEVPGTTDGIRILALRDLHDHRIHEGQWVHRALHDQLTGLVNRAAFLDRVDHAMRRGGATAQSVAVMFIDLDHFKPVNDRFGHAVGDAILARIAERLSGVAETGDTVARLGGDEFAVLLERAHEPLPGSVVDRGIDLAQRILDVMAEPIKVAGAQPIISASIGLAVADSASTTQSLLHDADLAMYEAKRHGAGHIRVFDPMMRRRAARLVEYRREVVSASARGHLRVVYLPQIALATGGCEGWEALVRWVHPELGTVEPDEFMPIAERAGVMRDIGAWVRRESLKSFARAAPEGFISVNLGQSEVSDPEGATEVLADIAAAGIAPQQVIVEITERLMDLSSDTLRTAVTTLRTAGVRIALDDLSAEGASLDLLHRAPVDLVKLSPAVVATATEGPAGLAALIVEVARRRGLWVVAEGVETEQQRRALIDLGCASGQGRAFSAPMAEIRPLP